MKNLGENLTMCQIWTNNAATGLQLCIPDLEQHRSLQQNCWRVISFRRFQMWSNTAAATRLTGYGSIDKKTVILLL